MPVIQASAKSEEAALAMVMLVPVVVTTRVGNIEAANNATSSSADALLAKNGIRSLPSFLEPKKRAPEGGDNAHACYPAKRAEGGVEGRCDAG